MNSKSSSAGVHQDIPRPSNVGNGQTLALAKCPLGIGVKLDLVAWEHIQAHHPEIRSREEVMNALESPQIIQRSTYRHSTLIYYRLIGRRSHMADGLYMAVVVDQIGSARGTVRTAHLCRRFRAGGEALWPKR